MGELIAPIGNTHQEPVRVLKADCGDGGAKRVPNGAMAEALAEVNWVEAGERSPGVGQGGNRREADSQSGEGLAGSDGRSCPARTGGISGETVKSAGAGETGGSGRSGGDERDTITRSERRTRGVQRRGAWGGLSGLSERASFREAPRGRVPVDCAKGRGKPREAGANAGSGLTFGAHGQARSEMLAL
jgi:hypothetical protein